MQQRQFRNYRGPQLTAVIRMRAHVKARTWRFLVTLLTLAFASLTQADDSAYVVTLANGEWAPYTSKNLKNYGVFSDIVTEAFALSGFSVRYEFMPWKRGYNMAKAGELDGSVTWAPTEEREIDFYFSDPVTFNSKAFFYLETSSFDWENISDLTDYRLGITRQYTYGDAFDRAVQDRWINVEVVGDDRQNILKLLGGRIDAFPMEVEVGYNLVNEVLEADQSDRIRHHGRLLQETPISVVISRKIDKERADLLLTALNNGLKKLRESGRYDDMLRNSRSGQYVAN